MLTNDALPLEYKLVNACARRDLKLADVVNDPVGLGVVWISGLSTTEQLLSFIRGNRRSLSDDSADLLVLGRHGV